MFAINKKNKRENLFQEIINTLRQWPELERNIFCDVHYHGQTPEAIASSLHLDIKKVHAILRQCDCRLHDSLQNFRKGSREKILRIPAATAYPHDYEEDLKVALALSSRGRCILHTTRKSA